MLVWLEFWCADCDLRVPPEAVAQVHSVRLTGGGRLKGAIPAEQPTAEASVPSESASERECLLCEVRASAHQVRERCS